MNTKSFEARNANLEEVLRLIDSELETVNCPMKTQMQIDVAVEEIFVNVASYAYHPEIGEVEVTVEIVDNPKRAVITFSDSGKPYNPLEKPDPDITLSAEERGIGGLGIYMVKKSMDEVRYEYTDNKNIFTIIKNI